MASDKARLAMLRTGLRGHPWAEVSDWEIRQGGISYTLDTVRAWKKRHPRSSLFWIMGSDQWEMLPSWKHPQELRKKLRFLVFPRPQSPRPRRGFRMMEIPLRMDISATGIRERLRQRLSIEGLVFSSVQRLIQRKRLYR